MVAAEGQSFPCLGKEVSSEMWKEAIVTFPTVKSKLPIISEEQLKDTSRDQCLLYEFSHALESGVVPDSVASATIGPFLHAFWLTLACMILCKALSTKWPTKSLSTILQFLQSVYVPAWFQIKFSAHVQFGTCHIYYMLELTRDLEPKSQAIVHKVLQDNSYFCHPENIVVSCLADPSEEVRRHGVH